MYRACAGGHLKSVKDRTRKLNDAPENGAGKYVLYWTQMNRRADSNHALEFAAQLANQRDVPLLVYEGLTCDDPFASDRFPSFLLTGVPETGRRLEARGIGYVFHLRRPSAMRTISSTGWRRRRRRS